jgi:hypothetical protein
MPETLRSESDEVLFFVLFRSNTRTPFYKRCGGNNFYLEFDPSSG